MTKDSLQTPNVLPTPFANDADERNSIQQDGSSDLTVRNGFGSVFSMPRANCGKSVIRKDMNGILYMLSTFNHYFQYCGRNPFRSDMSYPKGALVWLDQREYVSLVDGNTTNPNSEGNTSWLLLNTIEGSNIKIPEGFDKHKIDLLWSSGGGEIRYFFMGPVKERPVPEPIIIDDTYTVSFSDLIVYDSDGYADTDQLPITASNVVVRDAEGNTLVFGVDYTVSVAWCSRATDLKCISYYGEEGAAERGHGWSGQSEVSSFTINNLRYNKLSADTLDPSYNLSGSGADDFYYSNSAWRLGIKITGIGNYSGTITKGPLYAAYILTGIRIVYGRYKQYSSGWMTYGCGWNMIPYTSLPDSAFPLTVVTSAKSSFYDKTFTVASRSSEPRWYNNHLYSATTTIEMQYESNGTRSIKVTDASGNVLIDRTVTYTSWD